MKIGGKKLGIGLALFNLIVIGILFSNNIGNIIFDLTHVTLLDYYATYIIGLILIDIVCLIFYAQNGLNNVRDKIKDLVGEEELSIERYKVSKKFDNAESLWSIKQLLGYEYFSNEYISKNINIKGLNEEVFINLAKQYLKKENLRDGTYLGMAFFILLTTIFVAIYNEERSFERISVNKYISQYTNKYQELEYNAQEIYKDKMLKDSALNKLNTLRSQYVSEFGENSSIVKKVDEDIKLLNPTLAPIDNKK